MTDAMLCTLAMKLPKEPIDCDIDEDTPTYPVGHTPRTDTLLTCEQAVTEVSMHSAIVSRDVTFQRKHAAAMRSIIAASCRHSCVFAAAGTHGAMPGPRHPPNRCSSLICAYLPDHQPGRLAAQSSALLGCTT